MKIAVIGGVSSTELLVRKLKEYGHQYVHVWGYTPKNTDLISGWTDIGGLCKSVEYDHTPFRKIDECVQELTNFAPDVLFAVGLSQIIPKNMLSIAKCANVGFHPTALPRGRGRAAIAWMVLEQTDGAATFFELRDDMDAGPIFVQELFAVDETDDASSVEAKILEAEAVALDNWLPKFSAGDLSNYEQNHENANWYGRRTPEDGIIDWNLKLDNLLRLIRAAAPPHPGAFTYSGNNKVLILAADPCNRPEKGVVGRILQVHENGSFVVQAADGLLHVTCWTASTGWLPRVGMHLGYYAETEIFNLRRCVSKMREQIEQLERRIACFDIK